MGDNIWAFYPPLHNENVKHTDIFFQMAIAVTSRPSICVYIETILYGNGLMVEKFALSLSPASISRSKVVSRRYNTKTTRHSPVRHVRNAFISKPDAEVSL